MEVEEVEGGGGMLGRQKTSGHGGDSGGGGWLEAACGSLCFSLSDQADINLRLRPHLSTDTHLPACISNTNAHPTHTSDILYTNSTLTLFLILLSILISFVSMLVYEIQIKFVLHFIIPFIHPFNF